MANEQHAFSLKVDAANTHKKFSTFLMNFANANDAEAFLEAINALVANGGGFSKSMQLLMVGNEELTSPQTVTDGVDWSIRYAYIGTGAEQRTNLADRSEWQNARIPNMAPTVTIEDITGLFEDYVKVQKISDSTWVAPNRINPVPKAFNIESADTTAAEKIA